MADVALAAPANGIVEIAGPERVRLSDIVGRYLELTGDPRRVVGSPDAPYFGYVLDDDTLVPGDGARIAPTASRSGSAGRQARTSPPSEAGAPAVRGCGPLLSREKTVRIDSFRAMTSRRLRTIEAAATVRAAAAILSGSDVGLVVVCDDRGAATGVISKSDLVRHLARRDRPKRARPR